MQDARINCKEYRDYFSQLVHSTRGSGRVSESAQIAYQWEKMFSCVLKESVMADSESRGGFNKGRRFSIITTRHAGFVEVYAGGSWYYHLSFGEQVRRKKQLQLRRQGRYGFI
jgi:hypothetical protein